MFRAPPTSKSNPTSTNNNRNTHGNNSRNDSNMCDNSGMAWCSISSVSFGSLHSKQELCCRRPFRPLITSSQVHSTF